MHRQLADYKMFFEEASKKVLLHIQHTEEDSIQAKRLASSSMSRALCHDSGLTMSLWHRSSCNVLSLPGCICVFPVAQLPLPILVILTLLLMRSMPSTLANKCRACHLRFRLLQPLLT